jgi:hypothetical protein
MGSVQISVHFMGKCHIVDNVCCWVPTVGKTSTRAPRFVMTGRAIAIDFVPRMSGEVVAYIS